MPILDIQRRLAPAGRIRIGEQVPTGSAGKTRPAKLSTFRLTSTNRRAIESVAKLYGGEPTAWQDAPTAGQWQVYTTAAELPVVIPPERMSFSQWYEAWTGGGCTRRCDGVTDTISDGPCVCDPDKRACNMVTRLSLMLAELPGIGLWRLDTHGYYAGTEIIGSFEIVQMLSQSLGREVLPGTLRLEERAIKRGGKTNKFVVPILDLAVDMSAVARGNAAQLAGLTLAGESGEYTEIASSRTVPGELHSSLVTNTGASFVRALKPVPTDDSPAPSLPEQIAAVDKPPTGRKRANAAPALPSTGLAPRTAAEANIEDQGPASGDVHTGSDDADDSRRPDATTATTTPPVKSVPGSSSDLLTPPMLRNIQRLFTAAGVTTSDERHKWAANVVGRPVKSTSDLTIKEGNKLIDQLNEVTNA